MGKYTPGKVNLSDGQKDAIIQNLVKIADSVGNTGFTKKAGKVQMTQAEKEAYLNNLFNDPTGRGLKRVAYSIDVVALV